MLRRSEEEAAAPWLSLPQLTLVSTVIGLKGLMVLARLGVRVDVVGPGVPRALPRQTLARMSPWVRQAFRSPRAEEPPGLAPGAAVVERLV